MCVCWWCVAFCEYLLVLFGFMLVSGVIGLYILVSLCFVYGRITYILAFWHLSSDSENIMESWCGSAVPIYT